MLNVSFTAKDVSDETSKLMSALFVSKEHERRGTNLLVIHPADDVGGVPHHRVRHRDQPPPQRPHGLPRKGDTFPKKYKKSLGSRRLQRR